MLSFFYLEDLCTMFTLRTYDIRAPRSQESLLTSSTIVNSFTPETDKMRLQKKSKLSPEEQRAIQYPRNQVGYLQK